MYINGTYRHFKGNNYEVIGEAYDSDDNIVYVFYRQLYSPFEFWLRPKEMFLGTRNVNGEAVQRFVKIADSQKDILIDVDFKTLKINHSETKELYKIIGKDNEKFLVKKIDS